MEAVRRFFAAGDHFTAQTPWGPWSAFFMTFGFLLFQLLAGLVIGLGLVAIFPGFGVFARGMSPENLKSLVDIGIVTLALSYIAAFVFVLFVANLLGGNPGNVLQLKKPVYFFSSAAVGSLVMVLFFVLLSYLIETFFPGDAQQSEEQMKQLFRPIMESGFLWAGVFAIVIGAPVLEETIFRGFLLTSLAKSRLGFSGAALVSSGLWAVIHLYAPPLAVGLFVFGLLLSWMVRRTGSIWVSILLHAIWNGVVTAGVLSTLNAAVTIGV